MSTILMERSTGPEQLALLRLAHRGASDSAGIAEIVADVHDWELLSRLATRHRLSPLLFRRLSSIGLSAVPAEAETLFRDKYRASAGWNLLLTTHLCELLDEFESAGIRVIPYKGLVLAESYYGSRLYRPVGDIDVVVAPEQMEAAIQAACRLGYRQEAQGGYHRTLIRGNVVVEIHWGFAPSNFPLDVTFDELWARAERVRFSDREVVNLAPEDALILLSAHGTRHFWGLLIWLVDVAQLIDSRPRMNWDVVFNRAHSLGCIRVVAISLLLCKRLFSMNISTDVWDRHCKDMQVRRFSAMIERQLFAAQDEPKTSSVEQFLMRLAVRERLRDRITIIGAFLIPRESEWRRYHLPAPLRFLVYLLRPLRLIAGCCRWALSSRSDPFSPSKLEALDRQETTDICAH